LHGDFCFFFFFFEDIFFLGMAAALLGFVFFDFFCVLEDATLLTRFGILPFQRTEDEKSTIKKTHMISRAIQIVFQHSGDPFGPCFWLAGGICLLTDVLTRCETLPNLKSLKSR
jgi:hypothetical protein